MKTTLIFLFALFTLSIQAQEFPVVPGELSFDTCRNRSMAKFKFGADSMANFIARNIKYPKSEWKGTVTVSFVVEKDGTVSDVKILRTIQNEALEEAAIDIIKKTSGMWIPAKCNGKKVKSYCRIPIGFED